MTVKKPSSKKTLLAKQDKQSDSERYAKASMTASCMSAVLSNSFTKNIFPDMAIIDVADALNTKIKDVQEGNMQNIEAMLVGQAQALQTMFVSLGRQAASKTSLPQYTAFMNLALKAQSQSRATIQALTELKYPKQATFVKQANIAHGNQQVNNSKSNDKSSRAGEKNQNQSNELLEVENGSQKMDTGTTKITSRKDNAMATMEK
jgi:hypothetical protein